MFLKCKTSWQHDDLKKSCILKTILQQAAKILNKLENKISGIKCKMQIY